MNTEPWMQSQALGSEHPPLQSGDINRAGQQIFRLLRSRTLETVRVGPEDTDDELPLSDRFGESTKQLYDDGDWEDEDPHYSGRGIN